MTATLIPGPAPSAPRNSGLLVDGSARVVDYATLREVDRHRPNPTRSYRPVGFAEQVDMIERSVAELIDTPIQNRTLTLSKDGGQFLGAWLFDATIDGDRSRLMIIGGNSHTKMRRLYVAGGRNMNACTNGQVWGADVEYARKNTTNVYRDVQAIIDAAVRRAPGAFREAVQFADEIAEIPCHDVRGAEIIGWAQYLGVLRPQQATVAFREWKRPSHEEFGPRNLLSLYNGLTEAVKRGPGHGLTSRLVTVDTFMRDVRAKEQARADFIATARDCIRQVYSGNARAISGPSAALPAPAVEAELIDA